MSTSTPAEGRSTGRTALLVFAWLWVLAPFAYGVLELIAKVVDLFGG
ncbi:MFS transporter small subunit [Amycolatopsis panacis]|nr:hypothetical protein [Amycolatopsis panacis]